MRESFIFYKSFYNAIKDVDKESRLQLFEAICELAIYDNKKELSGIANTLFKLISPQIEANTERFENGKKGGRPKKQTSVEDILQEKTTGYENKKTTGFKNKKPNYNSNDNENYNLNANENNITPLSNKLDIPPKCENTLKKSTKPKKDLENDPLFLKFWEAYPKKANRPTAVKAYGKIKPMSYEVMDKILFGIERYKNSGLWSDKQFIPYPATFLNNRKWEDEVENLSVGVNRDGKVSYDIEEYKTFCRNQLMKPKSTDVFSETLNEQEKLEFIEGEAK